MDELRTPSRDSLASLDAGYDVDRLAYLDAVQALQTRNDKLPYWLSMGERLEASLDHNVDALRRGLAKPVR